MVSPALQRLKHHPTPWWSLYALTHPTVVRRTLRTYAGDSALMYNTVLACSLAGLSTTLMLALIWFMALNPRSRTELPSMWLIATAFTLIVMPPVYGIVLTQLRYAYRTTMAGVQRRDPGAFLRTAEAWEAERFGTTSVTAGPAFSDPAEGIARLPEPAQRSNREDL